MSTLALDRTRLSAATVVLGLTALTLRTPSYGAVVVTAAVGAMAVLTTAGDRPAVPSDPLRTAAIAVAGTIPFLLAMLWLRPSPSYGLWAAGASVIAAVAEELFFRRLVFGWLEGRGVVLAVGASAALFALVHVPAYGPAVLPIDFAAGLVFGWQRVASGSWQAPAATHSIANLLAVL